MITRREAVGVILLVLLFSVLIAAAWPYSTYTKTSRVPIYSIGDSLGVSGSFVLGTGYVESSPVFMYYADSKGGYKLDYRGSEYSVIYEDEKSNPYMETVSYCMKTIYGTEMCRWNRYDDYNFHIPPNSIRRSFTLDSK